MRLPAPTRPPPGWRARSPPPIPVAAALPARMRRRARRTGRGTRLRTRRPLRAADTAFPSRRAAVAAEPPKSTGRSPRSRPPAVAAARPRTASRHRRSCLRSAPRRRRTAPRRRCGRRGLCRARMVVRRRRCGRTAVGMRAAHGADERRGRWGTCSAGPRWVCPAWLGPSATTRGPGGQPRAVPTGATRVTDPETWRRGLITVVRIEWLVGVVCFLGLAYARTAPYTAGLLAGALVVAGAYGRLRWQVHRHPPPAGTGPHPHVRRRGRGGDRGRDHPGRDGRRRSRSPAWPPSQP